MLFASSLTVENIEVHDLTGSKMAIFILLTPEVTWQMLTVVNKYIKMDEAW